VTVAKLGVIGLFCFFGLKLMFFPDFGFSVAGSAGGMGLSQLQPFLPEATGWAEVFSAMGLTFIAFEGYEIIVQAGEEVVEPRRNIPRRSSGRSRSSCPSTCWSPSSWSARRTAER
jgi:amino acid transporter